ncbi:MAG TPA: hypothetical protein VGG73_12815 [Vicinamibacterales bacterium]
MKDHTDAAGLRRTPDTVRGVAPDVPVEADLAGVRTFQTRDLTQDRGFARGGRSEEDEHRPRTQADLEPRLDREAAGETLLHRQMQHRP